MTTCRKPKSPANATPGMEMMVSVEVSAETTESAMAHHGIGVVGEEVRLEGAVCCGGAAGLAEAKAKERDADEVSRYESEVEGAEPLGCEKICKGVDGTGQADSLQCGALT